MAEETVYVGWEWGKLCALDAHTGRRKWVFEAGGSITSSPACDAGLVFCHDRDGDGDDRRFSPPM